MSQTKADAPRMPAQVKARDTHAANQASEKGTGVLGPEQLPGLSLSGSVLIEASAKGTDLLVQAADGRAHALGGDEDHVDVAAEALAHALLRTRRQPCILYLSCQARRRFGCTAKTHQMSKEEAVR
jgi:hypothetical protein